MRAHAIMAEAAELLPASVVRVAADAALGARGHAAPYVDYRSESEQADERQTPANAAWAEAARRRWNDEWLLHDRARRQAGGAARHALVARVPLLAVVAVDGGAGPGHLLPLAVLPALLAANALRQTQRSG